MLILLRHGQSQWNLENRFTGWTDVPLSERGAADCEKAGKVLQDRGVRFDIGFTSRLRRASDTLRIILKILGQEDIPIEIDSALNERHYGDLQGLNKAEIAEKYGQEQALLWRRDYFVRPPNGESIEDTALRVTPFFMHYILPLVQQGKSVFVAVHGNSMRPMIKYLDGLTPEEAGKMELGLCIPYVYFFEGKKMVKKETWEVKGVVTLGASQTQKEVKEGRV
jgi:2,3-bisphosphoglycerate-dependent phosphoglycerate mutase